MNVNSDTNMPEGEHDKKFHVTNKSSIFDHAPLAAPEDDSDDVEYAQVKDVYGHEYAGGSVGVVGADQMYTFPHAGSIGGVGGGGGGDTTPNKSSSAAAAIKLRHRRDNKGQSIVSSDNLNCLSGLGALREEFTQTLLCSLAEYSDSDSESSSSERKNSRGYDGYYKMNRKAQTHKRMRKKRSAIPVQPPKVPFGTYVSPPEIPLPYQKMKTDKKLLGTVEKGNGRCRSFLFTDGFWFLIQFVLFSRHI